MTALADSATSVIVSVVNFQQFVDPGTMPIEKHLFKLCKVYTNILYINTVLFHITPSQEKKKFMQIPLPQANIRNRNRFTTLGEKRHSL